MASNWRPASIPLTGGLNTRTSDKALEPGQFAQLDNAVFDGQGAIYKRHGSTSETFLSSTEGYAPAVEDRVWVNGYGYAHSTQLNRRSASFPSLTGGPGETGSLRGLAIRDSELLAWDGSYMASRSPQGSASVLDDIGEGWTAINTSSTSFLRSTILLPHLTNLGGMGSVGDVAQLSNLDMAEGEKVRVVARVDQDNLKFYVSAFYVDTGAPIYQDLDITSITVTVTGTLRVVYVPSSGATTGFFVLAQGCPDSSDLSLSVMTEARPALWTDVPITSADFGSGLAARTHGGYGYIAWASSAGVVHVVRVDEYAATTDFTPATGTLISDSPIDLAFHPDGRLMLAWFQDVAGSPEAHVSFYNSDLTTLAAGPIQVGSTSLTASSSMRITCEWCLLHETNRSARVFFQGFDGSETRTWFGSVENTTAQLTDSTGALQVLLSGIAFRTGDVVCVPLTVSDGVSSMQAVVYWDNITNDVVPCAVWGRGVCSGSGNLINLSGVSVVPGQDAYNPLKFRKINAYFRFNGTSSAIGSATLVELDFGAPLRSAQAGRSTYFAGGMVKAYDGYKLYEAGFCQVPDPTYTATTGGSLTASSTYTYRSYLCYRNAQGEVTRSSAITRTVDLGVGEDEVEILLPPSFLNTRGDLYWEIYRSQANGSVLTLAKVLQGSNRYTPTLTSDTASDFSIATASVDPVPAATVNGVGVLDSVAPPACTVIAAGKERLWFAGGDLGPGQLAYSRLYDPGEGVTWNEALVQETDRVSPVTGLGFMGDWVIALARDRVHYIAGDGPSNLGQGDFIPARLVVSDLGALSPESVLLLPIGLAFQSAQGLRVLGAGGSLVTLDTGQMGSEVDASFEGQTVLGSCVVPEHGHGRWLLADGTQMVLDYTINRWTRWTGYQVAPELGETGGMVYLPSVRGAVIAAESAILLEDTSVYTDGGTPYRFIASMGWLSPHGPLSWGRLRRWALDGDALGAFTMKVYIDYDFKLSRRQTYTWAASTLSTRPDGSTYDHDPASWGEEASWGAGPVWGGDTADGGAFPTNVRFNRQHATSFRMTFTDDTEPNATFGLRGLSIEFSPKAGLVRMGGRNI